MDVNVLQIRTFCFVWENNTDEDFKCGMFRLFPLILPRLFRWTISTSLNVGSGDLMINCLQCVGGRFLFISVAMRFIYLYKLGRGDLCVAIERSIN